MNSNPTGQSLCFFSVDDAHPAVVRSLAKSHHRLGPSNKPNTYAYSMPGSNQSRCEEQS